MLIVDGLKSRLWLHWLDDVEGRLGICKASHWNIFPLSKLRLLMEDLDLHLIHGSLCTPKSSTQTASRSVQPFLQGSLVWQTDRPTDHATRSITIGCIYERSTTMRPKNGSLYACNTWQEPLYLGECWLVRRQDTLSLSVVSCRVVALWTNCSIAVCWWKMTTTSRTRTPWWMPENSPLIKVLSLVNRVFYLNSICGSGFWLAGCPSCHPANSVKALKRTRCTDPNQRKSPTGPILCPLQDSLRKRHCCLCTICLKPVPYLPNFFSL